MNIPLFLAYILSIIVMIGLPIALAVFFTRRFKVSWWVVLTGVLTFLVSQALRIPAANGLNTLFNNGTITVPSQQWLPVVNGLIGGLMAGIFEETARWAGFSILRRKADKFGSALALGAGHGGIESILLCVLGTGATLFTVLFFNAGAQIAKGVSTDQVQYVLAQIQQFWTTPWHFGLLPGFERVIALSTQIFLSTLVWKAIVDRSFIWFLLAVLYHMIIDAVAVFLTQIGWSYWAVEGVLSGFLILNVYMIYRFWKDESDLEKEMEELEDEEAEIDGEADENDEEEAETDDELDEIDDEDEEIEIEAEVDESLDDLDDEEPGEEVKPA